MRRYSGALAALMGGAGVAHFLAPAYFRGLVPAWVPAPRAVVVVSGLLDIGASALLVPRATRPLGGWATAALITAYLPAHLDAARRARSATSLNDGPLGVTARILANVGYIAWALLIATDAPSHHQGSCRHSMIETGHPGQFALRLLVVS